MAAGKKRAVPAAAREAFVMPDGGEVYVRPIRLDTRLRLRREVLDLKPKSIDEEIEISLPRLLAVSVVDEDGSPTFTIDEWCEYGATYPGTCLELYAKASSLSGYSAKDAEKN